MTKLNISKDLFNKVFGNDIRLSDGFKGHEDIEETNISFQSLEALIDKKLSQISYKQELDNNVNQLGRLGPQRVIFDVCSNVGSLVIESDRLGLSSHSGFSSIKANCCVYKGKWQYEVMLNTKGVMQIGWSTRYCQYSQEKGVGDTNDSYAYDGNRVRKWNVSTLKYGEIWQIGDCVTCAIDLDEGTVDFYRNGNHLGTAFTNVRIGKSYAYYPAISLAYQESIIANFGLTPLKFPVEGYQPLEAPPNNYISAGSLMIEWICNLIAMEYRNRLSLTEYLVCNKIFSKLSPILTNKYVIEECLLNKLMTLSCDTIDIILGLMWALLEEQQMHDCLECLTRSIINGFRFSPIITTNISNESSIINFGKQKQYLLVLLSLVKNTQTRHYLLKHILFECKFPLILDIKSLEDESLTSHLLSHVSIQTVLNGENIENLRNSSTETAISEVEALQDMILTTLLFQDDLSRSLFVNKLDTFVKETVVSNSRSQIAHQIIPNLCPVVLSMFQRLASIIRNQYRDAVNFISVTYFVDNESISNDSSRIGGMASYLQKQNQSELNRILEESVNLSLYLKHIYRILDNLMKMYSMGAHKHLGKLCAIREQLEQYLKSYKELKERFENQSVKEQVVEQTVSVLESKIVSYSRQLIIINSIELSESKKANIFWLMRLLLNTLDHASSCGHIFSFIPDYFIESAISFCSAIRFYFTLTSDEYSITSKREYESLLQQFASFIASHFSDERVTIAEMKDNLSQALASLVSNPETMNALESIPLDKRMKMVRSLCRPYENRAWAQTNWTMLRFWKGSGFAYRYSNPPNMTNKLSYPLNKEQTSLNYIKPHPSILYQSLIREYLITEEKGAIAFISSLLCQLNWSFAEFIGMLQEIQNSANRPQKVFVDSRQLKICSTCFDLTLALLRVLEMIISVHPELITLSPSNEMILIQLTQLVCQILNRVTITGCFDFVVDLEIPDLDSISHFQILAAVSGILIALTLKGSKASKDNAIRAIISDASFLPTSLLFLIGKNDSIDSNMVSDNQKIFDLTNFEEVNEEENSSLREMISMLVIRYQLLEQNEESEDSQEIPDDNDNICTICYANKKVAVFWNCGHMSCRTCIAMHFLRNGEMCFFCKANIERVLFNDSSEVLYPKKINET